MNIKNTIAAINEMQAAGVIQRYAIGGAVGATFYLEPVATLDVDVFISFQSPKDWKGLRREVGVRLDL